MHTLTQTNANRQATCIMRSSKCRSSLPFNKNVYVRPLLPTIAIFFGLVFVSMHSTCLWKEYSETPRSTAVDELSVPGMGMSVERRDARYGEMLSRSSAVLRSCLVCVWYVCF